MTITYQLVVLHSDREDWLAQIGMAIDSELRTLGLHTSVTVSITEGLASANAPTLALVLVGPTSRHNRQLHERIEQTTNAGLVVIPVVDDLMTFEAQVPPGVSTLNGLEWSGPEPATRLARAVLEELGIEERARKVFISHRRSDGQRAAEQLHDELSHLRFEPFIDRFMIRPGEGVQERIADALEQFAFLLVLETPDAHLSHWVFHEVAYALAHTMGLLIVQWPGSPNLIPGTDDLPRLVLAPEDVIDDPHDCSALTPSGRDRVLREVERAHAVGLVRRRQMLLANVRDAAEVGGAVCTPLTNGFLDVVQADIRTIVAVSPRLPLTEDLQRLDETRNMAGLGVGAVLIHSTRRMANARKKHLEWAIGGRELKMFADNTVGGIW